MAYISFWSINNGLTQATVLPVVRYLLAEGLVEHITLFTPEENKEEEAPAIEGMTWHPVHSAHPGFTSSGFQLLKSMFRSIARYLDRNRGEIDLLWARASTAGGCAALLARRFKLPFGVESFEPHADYMVESGAWKRNGLKDRVQRWLEARQVRKADVLITVSEAYAEVIRSRRKQRGKVFCIPCVVDYEVFKPDEKARNQLRAAWGIQKGAKLGVYLGKLGDIYYDLPFVRYVKSLLQEEETMHFLFITPDPDHIQGSAKEVQLPMERVHIHSVKHHEVPAYLSAADIAFCPVKPAPSKRYCSPIKNGEYWACGLPVVMSPGVGDDAFWVEEQELGVVLDLDDRQTESQSPTTSLSKEEIRARSKLLRSNTEYFSRYKEILSLSR